jgi:hypothetical protein
MWRGRLDATIACVQLYATTEATRAVCSSGLVLDVPAASALRAAPDTLLVPGGECLVTS